MTLEMWYTLGILLAAIILFVVEWVRVDVVALGVVVALMLLDILTTDEALAGFSNTTVITIAALFVVGGAVLQTGLAAMIGDRILDIAGQSEVRLLILVMLGGALLSCFMGVTGTAAVLLPSLIALARKAKISPSQVLMPLAFGSLLGGMTTLIGTPPNIVASNLLKDAGYAEFNFFSYTPLGLVLVVVGILFMVTVGRRILPNRIAQGASVQMITPEELLSLYRLPDNMYRLRVADASAAVGLSLAEVNLRREFGISILEILRPPVPQPLLRFATQQIVLQSERPTSIHPQGDTTLQSHDILLVQGDNADVQHAMARWGLSLQTIQPEDKTALLNQEVGIAEALIRPRSTLIGETVVSSRFGTRYRLTVLSLKRPATDTPLDTKTSSLRVGDTLLVQGMWKDIQELKNHRRDFIVLGLPEAEEIIGPPHRGRAPIVLAILLGMVILMVFTIVPTVTASLIAALALILSGCLTIDEAYEAIDWRSVILIGGMLPMATALDKVGLIEKIVGLITDTAGEAGPLAVLVALFLLTSAVTQVISNTATSVLMAPIALAVAIKMGVQPHAFMMGVAIAASTSFATPVGTPVNMLMMAPGNYRFSDFIKAGVPMIVLTTVIAIIMLPMMWPF